MPDLDNIPTAKTAEELAALRASDPAAFDDDEEQAPEQVEAAQAAADEAAEKEAAEKAEADRIAAEKAEAEKQAAMIPKGRLNEVLRERDAERERADALAAEIAALKAGPKIDYDAEIVALQKKYEEDDDLTLDDYMAQRDALLVGKVKADARAEIEQEQAQAAAQRAEQAWADAANAFVAAHPEYAEGEAKVDLEAALHGVFAKFPTASDADKLERAHKIVLAMNGKAEPAAPAAATEALKGPHAARDAADAQAAAKASAAPPPVNGGVSSAGGPIGNVDFANMKPGTFSKLTKDQQAAALGSPDAL